MEPGKDGIKLISPECRYAAADQAADLGGLVPFTARLMQMSATVGPGYALEEIIDV